MRLAFLAFAAFASVASAQDYPACDNNKLIGVVAGSDSSACSSASGYSPVSGSLPTDDQYIVLCFNSQCSAFLNELKASNPNECVIKGIFPEDRLLYASMITPIETECNTLRGTTAPPPSGTTAAPTADPNPTVTPAPTMAPTSAPPSAPTSAPTTNPTSAPTTAPIPSPTPTPGPAC